MVTEVSNPQLENVASLMVLIDVGMMMEVMEDKIKARSLMVMTEVGILMEVREHDSKAYLPILVTVEGINTEVMVLQLEKALSGIKDTSLGMVINLLTPQEEQLLQGK